MVFGLLRASLFAEAQAEVVGGHEMRGVASWYAGKFQGRITANGEVFDTNLMTAAHKTLPFDTVVRVRHLENGRTVDVRINDRGPFVEGRVIDLSRAAAEALRMTAEGVADVLLVVLTEPPPILSTIQIASFGSAANAERTRARLARAGLDVRIEESGDLYRVVIQGVGADEVPTLRGRLAELGFSSVLVRQE